MTGIKRCGQQSEGCDRLELQAISYRDKSCLSDGIHGFEFFCRKRVNFNDREILKDEFRFASADTSSPNNKSAIINLLSDLLHLPLPFSTKLSRLKNTLPPPPSNGGESTRSPAQTFHYPARCAGV